MGSPFEAELEAIFNEYEERRKKSQYPDCSDVISTVEVSQFISRCMAAVERSTGKESVYYNQLISVNNLNINLWEKLPLYIGIVKSLLDNIRAGYVKSLEEIIHGDVFSDFLEMGEYLNLNGYKDAAAVITGSTLEAHLRQLCKKWGINTLHGGKIKKADTLNSELAGAGAYSKLDQKNVTAWLGLRNDAAHGNYANYSKEQVSLLISSVRDFITRVPA